MTELLQAIEAAPEDDRALADDDRSLSYGELRSEIRRVARWVIQRHGRGRYLLLRAPVRADSIVTLLGVLYGGNIPVPVDPEASEEMMDYMRGKCGTDAVVGPLSTPEYADLAPLDEPTSTETAMVLFTSGTSGYPKGVLISQQNLSHSCDAISEYLDYRTHRSAAVVLPLHYSYALLSQVCCQLYVGGYVRLFPSFRNPLRFARIVEEEGIQTFCGVPSTYVGLVTTHGMSPLHMPSVRVLCSAGAAMDRGRYETVKEIFPNATFFNNYGMTEAAPRLSWISDRDPRFHEPTCGRAMRGVELQIIDPESQEPLEEGREGVLAVRGPNITPGYLHDPERTAEAFTREGFLISGDTARLDGGYIFLRGRKDDQFNVAGEKVAPLEIERILDRCPGVRQSAVIGVPDDAYGRVPIGFLELNGELSEREILHFLKGQLPAVKLPRRFFAVKSLPRTASGKLQRRMLAVDDATYVIREIT